VRWSGKPSGGLEQYGLHLELVGAALGNVSYRCDHTGWHAAVHHSCSIILTVARFRLSYLYDHTDWHASVHHTCTIILTVTCFRLSYLHDHTDCGTLPFIIPIRSYLQRTKQYKQREEKGCIIINICFSSKEEEEKARTQLHIDRQRCCFCRLTRAINCKLMFPLEQALLRNADKWFSADTLIQTDRLRFC
jgi:hypothetical protein